MALREPTRIKIEGDVITDLFGDVYDSKQNPNGRVVWESDKKKGEVILRLREESTRPVNLFVSTDKATYTLVLAPRILPADTIVLRDRTPAPKLDTSSGLKAPSFHRLLKNMLVSMATNTIQPGIEIREVDQESDVVDRSAPHTTAQLLCPANCRGPFSPHQSFRGRNGAQRAGTG
jgi:conjugal transfer pilus assembly protein TraK